MVPMCFGALRGRPPSNGANWNRQASHEGKSGPVETGLTGPAATALQDFGKQQGVVGGTGGYGEGVC